MYSIVEMRNHIVSVVLRDIYADPYTQPRTFGSDESSVQKLPSFE
jgi:hypothetical protein